METRDVRYLVRVHRKDGSYRYVLPAKSLLEFRFMIMITLAFRWRHLIDVRFMSCSLLLDSPYIQ